MIWRDITSARSTRRSLCSRSRFPGLGSQPNPFRRFAGARLVELPLGYDRPSPGVGELGGGELGGAPVLPLDAGSLGLFLELGLGLSAWKAVDGARWAVRNNPSSGNLHPTEAYLVLPALEGIGKSAALWHYAVAEHALEERCVHDRAPDLPEGCFLVGLGSIVWREAWKYGERAFRYVQHDVGHAVGSLSYAAACLGWRLEVLAAPGDAEVAGWLGLDREDASHPYEREHPDLMAVIHTRAGGASCLALPERPAGTWFGAANAVSEDHEPWPVIDTALRVTVKPSGVVMPVRPVVEVPSLPAPARSATEVIRARRSVMRMDGGRVLGLGAFYRMLAATLPDAGRVPWNAFPWPARLALFVFVHRVEGLERGLYALVRDPDSAQRLRAACSPEFAWEHVPDCPLPLFRLSPCDLEREGVAAELPSGDRRQRRLQPGHGRGLRPHAEGGRRLGLSPPVLGGGTDRSGAVSGSDGSRGFRHRHRLLLRRCGA